MRGHGTWDNDRIPIAGIVGRDSSQIKLRVCHHSDRNTLQPYVEAKTRKGATVNTDEWQAYDRLPRSGRIHKACCHTPGKRQWAIDEEGDGIRAVHCNTMEGIWAGLRNFLRPFRGVNKAYLSGCVAIFEWSHNLKRITDALLRRLMTPFTLKHT